MLSNGAEEKRSLKYRGFISIYASGYLLPSKSKSKQLNWKYLIYNLFASSMVSGSFFLYVSGLKMSEIAAKITDPPNNRAGSE